MNLKLIFCFLFITCSFTYAQQEITVQKVWKEYQFMSRGGSDFTWQPSGTKYTKIQTSNNGSKILEMDIAQSSALPKTIVSEDDLVYKGKMLEVIDYTFNSDQSKLILVCNKSTIYRHSYDAEHYVLDLKTKIITLLDEDNKKQTLATFNPKGNAIAYIANRNIYVKDLNSNTSFAITNDGAYNAIINGTSDWVYEEEFAITQCFNWSPDGKNIAYLKFDESKVKEFTMSYYGELYPTLYPFKYPKAGEDNSKVSAYIYNIDNNTTQEINLGDYEYIPRINWSTTQNTLVLQTLNRHQNNLQYYKVEQNNGIWKANVFHQEKATTYIEIDDNLEFFSDGKSILRTSDKDGYTHIYKVGLDGKETQLTKGNWDVISLYGLDPENKALFFSAAKKGAIHQGIYRLDLKKEKMIAISEEEHKNTASFTADKRFFIKTFSTANTPHKVTLCDYTGKEIQVLSDNAGVNKRAKDHGFVNKRFLKINLEGRTLNAWMLLPQGFDSTKQYPVFVNVYGGPGSNMVYDGWDNNMGFHQLLAQQGYIVMSVDPRGTQYNGAEFKKSTYLNLGKLETIDFVDFAKHIQKWSFVDGDRIGIQGWSYGGFMAANCMMKGEGIYKMGIAVAPVTHWKYYDNIYTERYMRTPQENPQGYDINSPLSAVNQLQGKFFLIHGSADDNVHYQNALELVTKLVEADKQFDLFIYPNKDHGIHGGNTRNHLFQMILTYIKNNL